MTAPPTTHPDSAPAPAARRRRITPMWLVIGAAALVAVLLVALFAVIAWSAFDHADDRRATGRDRVVTGPRDGRPEATLELLSGVTSVTVRAADLDGALYRVETPVNGRHVPQVTNRDGAVQVQLGDSGAAGPSTVDILLAATTRWTVRMVAGATRQSVDLSAGRVAGVEFIGGVTSIDLSLPHPAGTVPVRMNGGVSTWAVHLPAGVPARVLAGGGAGSVTLDAVVHSGVSGGTAVTTEGWDGAADRYDVTAAGGMSAFTLDRR